MTRKTTVSTVPPLRRRSLHSRTCVLQNMDVSSFVFAPLSPICGGAVPPFQVINLFETNSTSLRTMQEQTFEDTSDASSGTIELLEPWRRPFTDVSSPPASPARMIPAYVTAPEPAPVPVLAPTPAYVLEPAYAPEPTSVPAPARRHPSPEVRLSIESPAPEAPQSPDLVTTVPTPRSKSAPARLKNALVHALFFQMLLHRACACACGGRCR